MGTLVWFTLLLCYIGSYMFPGGVGTCSFVTPCPVFTVGKSRLVVVAVQGAPSYLFSFSLQIVEVPIVSSHNCMEGVLRVKRSPLTALPHLSLPAADVETEFGASHRDPAFT
jgi:hypothetical protein